MRGWAPRPQQGRQARWQQQQEIVTFLVNESLFLVVERSQTLLPLKYGNAEQMLLLLRAGGTLMPSDLLNSRNRSEQ